MISRTQALERLSESQIDRRLWAKAWVQLFPGVYRLEGTPSGWAQKYQALKLYLGEGFAFSHRSAGALHRLRDAHPESLEIVATRQVRLPGVIAHRVPELPLKELAWVEALPVTDVTRTVVELSTVLSPRALRRAADRALQRKRTSVESLTAALGAAGHRRGVAQLRDLLERYRGGDGPAESELEALVLDVLEDEGLPRPVRQRTVWVEGRVRRLDLLYPLEQVVIEADGYASHSSPESFEADRERNNALLARGLRVLHWTWEGLHARPRALVAQLAALLGRPG